MKTKKEFLNAISRGHIKPVIDNLLNLNLPQTERKTIFSISNQYYTLMEDINKGIVRRDHEIVEKNQITNNLLNFVFDLGTQKRQQQENRIKCFTATIDTVKSSWKPFPNAVLAFFQDSNSPKSPFPIFNFVFRNETKNDVLLTQLQLNVKSLPSGIHGLPQASVMKPIARYKWSIVEGQNIAHLSEPIIATPNAAFLFQIQLSEKSSDLFDDQKYPIDGRKALDFSFQFNDDILLRIPKIYLNCKSENDGLDVYIMR